MESQLNLILHSLLLPLRAIGDSIGAATSWNTDTKIAHISYNGKDSYVSVKSSQTSTNKNNNSNTSDPLADILIARSINNPKRNSIKRNIDTLSNGGLTGLVFY